MKKTVLFICSFFICLFGFATANAQTTGTQLATISAEQATTSAAETKTNLISLDIFRFLGFYNLSYTRVISPAFSVTAQLETPTNFLFGSIFQETGFGARLEGRWNFSQKNLLGIYIAPVVGFNSSTYRAGSLISSMGTTNNDYSATLTWVALGGLAGYQFAPFTGLPELMLGFGIGAEYNIINATVSGGGTAPSGTPIPTGNMTSPRFRATFGYAW